MKNRSVKFIVYSVVFVTIISCIGNKNGFKRVDKILHKMTLREKLEFIGGYHSFNIRPFEEYDIPEIRMSDGPVGVRNYGLSTAYPASINLAASWDKEMAKKVGMAIGMEARSQNVHIVLGPGMNIYRAPFCGRNFEYLGEDPFLAGEIASSYILGMQEQGVIATAKHYVANFQDYNRHHVSSDMDERTLHEIYLPAFKACVTKGKAGAVMTAYNLVNGIHCSEHDYLINQVLKKGWAFNGVVMSDWTSTYDGVACALAGLDLEMPAGVYMHPDTLLLAIENGRLTESVIDDKVKRILMLYERFGYFDNPDISQGFQLDSQLVRNIAIDAARGGITLLKNKNKILPFNKSKPYKIAVIGINADPAVTGGGGSSYTRPRYPVSLLEAVKKVAGEEVEVIYAKGLFEESKLPKDYFQKSHFYSIKNGEKIDSVKADFYDNVQLEGTPVYSGYFSHIDHDLKDSNFANVPDINYSIRFQGNFKVEESGNYQITVAGDDGYRVFLNGKKIIEYWQNQAETVRSYDVVLKAGKENKFSVEYFQAGGDASIRFGYKANIDKKTQERLLWNAAVNAAKTADYVVLSAGFNEHTEHEGADRTMDLPYEQDKLIKAMTALNKNCIVVLNAGGNINMPWYNDIAGLLHAWYPGQEGNIAVAEILFGETNPSGRLPASFEKQWSDNATYNSYADDDEDGRVYFSEGIFLGYRHFDQSGIKPMFPFGFGLSYTTFEYSDIKLDIEHIRIGFPIGVSFTLKNTGDYDGAVTAQVYVSDLESKLVRPVKELKGFEKVFLEQGEEKRVSIILGSDAFKYYDPDSGGWITEPGEFNISVGNSSQDIRLETKLLLE